MSRDILIDMFDELRRTRPAVYLADEFLLWYSAVGQTIAAFPTEERRQACCLLVANDLCRAMPGLSLASSVHWVLAVVAAERGEVRR